MFPVFINLSENNNNEKHEPEIKSELPIGQKQATLI